MLGWVREVKVGGHQAATAQSKLTTHLSSGGRLSRYHHADRSAPDASARVWTSPQSPRRRPGAHHPRFRRASGAHRIDGVDEPLALALHALLAGNLTFAGG